jgi:hypothetical protein
MKIDKAKEKQEEYRRAKTPMKKREWSAIVFFDFKKAYDNVRRPLLIKELLEFGFEPKLVSAIKNLLTETKMSLDGKIISTEKGAPQGAVLSPDNWNFYIAKLGDRIRRVKDGTLNEFRLNHTSSN